MTGDTFSSNQKMYLSWEVHCITIALITVKSVVNYSSV